MNTQVNRAILLWENWQEKQAMLEGVFGQGVGADLVKQKLDFLNQGINRISVGATPDEKLVLDLIKKTTKRMEKQLYPNLVARTLRRMKNLFYDRPRQASKLKKQKAENVVSLDRTLSGLGLNSKKLNLEKVLDFEQKKINVDLVAPYGTDHNFGVRLQLEKDSSGQYQLHGYTATLKDPLNPEQNRSFTFDSALGINAREAANLLQGRAVLKHYQIGANRMASKWVQLDFKNLTQEGKPQMKEMPGDYEFNIRQEATKIAIELNKPELADVKALNGMEAGNQIALKQVNGETTYLEANPLNKEITIRNDQQQPITMDPYKKQKEAALKLKHAQVKVPAKKVQLSKKQQRDQSIGIA